ncbi:hypothetical protein, conserved [Plasmodium gonderi]|uniref:Uncharacterized protein n=1 Tax=Plasmodium gonderi TaxID=77519 RepID=A0A1Y1JIJ8_PLAGO|nr:hypothetical protein, conserved [Plasmodium gonderi]GAW82351.1 hypothetical protein, conserved [Plasmodium gonderi]
MPYLESTSQFTDDPRGTLPRVSDSHDKVQKKSTFTHDVNNIDNSGKREDYGNSQISNRARSNSNTSIVGKDIESNRKKEKQLMKNSKQAENIINCNDEELKKNFIREEGNNSIPRIERSTHKYYEKERVKHHRNYYNIRKNSITSIVNNENTYNNKQEEEGRNDVNENTIKIETKSSATDIETEKESIMLTASTKDITQDKKENNQMDNRADRDVRIYPNIGISEMRTITDHKCNDYSRDSGNGAQDGVHRLTHNDEINHNQYGNNRMDENKEEENNTQDVDTESWIEIQQPFNLWDVLKNNFKNVFLVKSEDMNPKGEEKVSKCEENTSDQIRKRNDEEVIQIDKGDVIEVVVKVSSLGEDKDQGKQFPLSPDVYAKCLNFLSVDKILECELINKLSSHVINNRVNVFTYVKKLTLDEKWSHIPIYKRQYYLHQMKNVKHLNTSEKIYSGNGIYIHEVAAIIFQNVSNLKTLELLSPEYCMNDNTPRHEPFALCPSVFSKLEKLTIIGCQTLEWLHIFRNCSFPLLKKFEVCYYPIHHDHWVWKFVFDFTILGLQGLYKMLYTMENLQKLIIGFDVLFDNIDGYLYNPIESHRNVLHEFNFVTNNQRYTNTLSSPPANGNPSRKFKSYRGKLCEEDFSDIFTIAYYISGKCGKLKRIMIKYRDSYDKYEDELDNDETLNEFISEATNTASSYYNYVLNWFRSTDELMPSEV